MQCLMGRGYVLQAANKWEDAAKLFKIVADQAPNDIETGLVAREEHGWCMVQLGRVDEALQELQEVLDELEQVEGYETRKARLWWRVGQCYWRLGGEDIANA